jgi:hypothetical protein
MPSRWSTVQRHDAERAPGLDLSRGVVVGFLIAAAMGLLAGAGWLGYLWLSRLAGGQ